MNNCYMYYLTAVSDLKPNCSGEPGNYELDENTYEFEALVEAGPSRMMKTKVYSLGKLPIEVEFISLFQFNKENIKNDYACFWNYSYKKSKIFPLKTILYEGYAFPCPNDVDSYLRTCFGDDYMILPDSQMRNNHKISEIKFL